jgi:hypothetical protein
LDRTYTAYSKGNDYALDYRRVALDSLVVGYGQFIHAGWIHSYPAGLGGDCDLNPPDPGPKPGTLSSWGALQGSTEASMQWQL